MSGAVDASMCPTVAIPARWPMVPAGLQRQGTWVPTHAVGEDARPPRTAVTKCARSSPASRYNTHAAIGRRQAADPKRCGEATWDWTRLPASRGNDGMRLLLGYAVSRRSLRRERLKTTERTRSRLRRHEGISDHLRPRLLFSDAPDHQRIRRNSGPKLPFCFGANRRSANDRLCHLTRLQRPQTALAAAPSGAGRLLPSPRRQPGVPRPNCSWYWCSRHRPRYHPPRP